MFTITNEIELRFNNYDLTNSFFQVQLIQSTLSTIINQYYVVYFINVYICSFNCSIRVFIDVDF